MADKLFVDIGASTEGLKKGLDDAEKELKDFGKKTEEGFKKVGEGAQTIGAGLKESRSAMSLLNRETEGLAQGWIKVAKASKVSGKAMKSALISSGIGALVVIFSEVLNNWDAIVGAISGANEKLRIQKKLTEDITTELKRQSELKDLNNRFLDNETKQALLRAKIEGGTEDELFKIRKRGLQSAISIAQERFNETKLILEKSKKADREIYLKADKAHEQSAKDLGEALGAISIADLENQLRINNLKRAELKKYGDDQLKIEIETQKELKKFRDAEEKYDLKILKDRRKRYQGFFDAEFIAPDFVTKFNEFSQSFRATSKEIEDNVPDFAKVGISLDKVIKEYDEFDAQLKALVTGQISNTLNTLATEIGTALAGAGDATKSMGDRLLGFFGTLLKEFGAVLITIGTGIVIADIAFKSGNGYAAIAAGVAMVALGVLLSSKMSQGVQMATDGSSASGSVGGSGSTSFTGSTANSSNAGSGTYVFEIEGTKLVGVLSNTLARNRALGGSLSIT